VQYGSRKGGDDIDRALEIVLDRRDLRTL